MRSAIFDGFLRVVELEQTVDEAAGEAVAAADAVKDFQVFAIRGLVEFSIRPADRPPMVARGRSDCAQGGRCHFEIRVVLHRLPDHFLEGCYFEARELFIHTFDFETEAGGEILLIADHDIYVPGNRLVDLLGFPLPADALPQGRAVVQIVRDYRAVFSGGLHGFDHELRRGIAERGEDAARVQPARAELAKNMVPIEVARLELAGR